MNSQRDLPGSDQIVAGQNQALSLEFSALKVSGIRMPAPGGRASISANLFKRR
jgi:hypothetical protein